MIRYCKDCKHVSSIPAEGGVKVLCAQVLAPESWRNKWLFRSTKQCIEAPLKCPIPEMWFDKKD